MANTLADATIRYRTPQGVEKSKRVVCHAVKDTPETLKAHINTLAPQMVFLSATIEEPETTGACGDQTAGSPDRQRN